MTEVMKPVYDSNRSSNNAYGCGCCCSAHWNNFEQARDLAKTFTPDTCLCTCYDGRITNNEANTVIAYEHTVYSIR